VAVNDSSIDERLLEIGVDSFVLVGGKLTCEPSEESAGGGCAAGNQRQNPATLLVLLGIAAALRRRSRV
jgi:hypothetical protein